MRRWQWLPLVLAPLALGACGGSTFPTGDEIDRSLDEQLRSVAGDWTGIGPGQAFTLSFRLAEAAGGQVTGSGTMQERGAPAAPLTIVGTYKRPDLALILDGLVYEGRAVRGTLQGRYTSVGGVSDTLVLTGEGYTRRLAVLLQETSR